MKFLVDAQLPRRLADWLTQQGHDALHARSASRQSHAGRGSDRLRGRRRSSRWSKDADFVNSFQLRGQPGRLLLVSTGNMSNEELVKLWEKHLSAIVRAAESSRFVELTTNAVVIHA